MTLDDSMFNQNIRTTDRQSVQVRLSLPLYIKEARPLLPVQCLCEFLLHDVPTDSGKDGGDDEQGNKGGVRSFNLLLSLHRLYYYLL